MEPEQGFIRVPVISIILSLLHKHIFPPPQLWDSPDEATQTRSHNWCQDIKIQSFLALLTAHGSAIHKRPEARGTSVAVKRGAVEPAKKGRRVKNNTAPYKHIQDNIKEPSSWERQGGTRSAPVKRNNKKDVT
jgi:hypothetical protein